MSVSFIEPDFSKYRQHKNNRPSVSRSNSASAAEVDPLDKTRPNDNNNGNAGGSYQRRVSFDTIRPANSNVSESSRRNSSSSNVDRVSTNSSQPRSYFFLPTSFMSSTSSNKERPYSSYFVSSRHENHLYTSDSRTFMCSLNSKAYSFTALRWLMQTMLRDGDEVVCLRLYNDTDDSFRYQTQASKILKRVVEMADEHQIRLNIVVELGVGKIKTVVYKTLVLYQPSLVVVGVSENSFSNFKRMRYKRSISSYLIAKSPVPVIIVSPEMLESNKSNKSNAYFANLIHNADSDPVKRRRSTDTNKLQPVNTNNTSAYSELITSDDDYDEDDGDDEDDEDDIDYDADYDVEDEEEDDDEYETALFNGGTKAKIRQSSVDSNSSSLSDSGSLKKRFSWRSLLTPKFRRKSTKSI